MLKLSQNPPIRSSCFASVSDMPARWWVAHTRSRCEKAFAWDMETARIGYFLPMVRRVTFSGGRKRHGMAPLFAGYVFLNADADQRLKALRTDRLCAVHPVTQTGPFLEQIQAIERSLEHKLAIDVYPHAVVGRPVRVKAGPLQGVVGKIVDRDRVPTLVIEVAILGQNASVPIEADLVEVIE